MERYDAILVPGGGVRPGGDLPPWVADRLDHAIARHGRGYILPLSAGTTHKPPPLDAEGFPIFESVAAARYLIKGGIDPAKILLETSSYDTIGNAYFSRVIHIAPLNLRRLLIVTSCFHMPRTEAIFRWVYSLCPGSYELEFEKVPDRGIEPRDLDVRVTKERESLANLLPIINSVTSLRQLHHWLFTEHEAYGIAPPRSDIGGAINTY